MTRLYTLGCMSIRRNIVRRRFDAGNRVTVFRGDCAKLLRALPDESVQLVVTSPPYNVGKSYEQREDLESYLDRQASVIGEIVRVLKVGGSICWQVGNYVRDGAVTPLDIVFHPLFAAYKKSHDVVLRNRIVWQYEFGLNCSRRFSGRYETVLWYTKGKDYVFNLDAVRVPQKYPGKRAYKGPKKGELSGHPLGKNPGDVWSFPNVKASHPEKTIHPCQFPVELVERLVLALSRPDDLVLDPYLGAGSTAIAAILHGRRSAGAETVREYASVAEDRIKRAAVASLQLRSRHQGIQTLPDSRLSLPEAFAQARERQQRLAAAEALPLQALMPS